MKLRIHNNSIRLRLSQTEVEKIGKGQPILEALKIGLDQGSFFNYSLIPADQVKEISSEFVEHNLKVILPKDQAVEWAHTDEIGISAQLQNGVSIMIEKDFQCLHKRPGEDERDNFPNPLSD